jgi:lysozyme family protein
MQGYFRDKDQLQNWRDFNLGIDRMGGVGPNLRRAFREINAAEGGGVPDSSDPKGPAVAGITLDTLGRYPTPGTGPKPTDVKPWQWPAVYGAYFDRELADAHGRETLDKIRHPGVATFVADTVFRKGDKGVEMIQRAVNNLRLVNGEARIKKDGKFGPETLDALNRVIAVPEDRQIFAEQLRKSRDTKHPDESRRNRHFYELAAEGD